jgi:hypothetical protein
MSIPFENLSFNETFDSVIFEERMLAVFLFLYFFDSLKQSFRGNASISSTFTKSGSIGPQVNLQRDLMVCDFSFNFGFPVNSKEDLNSGTGTSSVSSSSFYIF